MTPKRILHIGDFGRKSLQQPWFNTEQKLANGFVREGHFVLRFSDRDEARNATPFGTQKMGVGRMNQRLIATAEHFRPELVVFHHADLIRQETFRALRKLLPGARMVQVNVDPTERPVTMAAFTARAAELDLSFITTGDSAALKPLAPRPESICFIPNPVDPSVETARAFETSASELTHDAQFLGNSNETRDQQLTEIAERLPQGFRWFAGGGAFGSRKLSSLEFLEALAQAAMSPSLQLDDRRSLPFLYSSNRIAQLLGQGTLALTPASSRQEALYDDGVVPFEGRADLAEKMVALWRDDDRRRRIAEIGWRIGRERTGCARVARYLTEAAFEQRFSEDYGWPTERLA